MGWGDELIVTGQARELQGGTQRKVVVYDRHGRIRAHDMWRNNPRILGRSDRSHKPIELVNGPGHRPYIAGKSEQRWTWREWQCPVGEIYLSPDEIAFALPHVPQVVIEPNVKQNASPNKNWGHERWTRLVALMRVAGVQPWQLGSAGTQLIPGAKLIETPDFRYACAVLARAKAAVLPEGGLHHAAAALKVPAVVIFGGYIGPKQTGYEGQVSLFTGGQACGMRIECLHCAAAMAAITPELVMERLMHLLQPEDSQGARPQENTL